MLRRQPLGSARQTHGLRTRESTSIPNYNGDWRSGKERKMKIGNMMTKVFTEDCRQKTLCGSVKTFFERSPLQSSLIGLRVKFQPQQKASHLKKFEYLDLA